jgi:hypothetical protein
MSDYNRVIEILNDIEHERRRKDAILIVDIIREVIHVEPKLWDDNYPGFGNYHYINKTNEGDMPILSLAVAKAHITIYFAVRGLDPYKSYLSELGQHRRGKICLYISNMDKINLDVFKQLIKESYDDSLILKIKNDR